MNSSRLDVVVVGAGIIGLATARELVTRRPGLRIAVLDKEQRVGEHQTRRSSGVVHRGVYYAPGSVKADLCVAGAAGLLAYCDAHAIPVLRCGKVVVATNRGELSRLEELYRRSVANGVPGVELVSAERLAELEPHVRGIQALHSPGTAVVDFQRVAEAFADDVRGMGGLVLLGHDVRAIRTAAGVSLLETTGGDIQASVVVTCAGLHADRVSTMTGGSPDPRIIPFRGDYLRLRPERRGLVRGLVYPVPDPAFPFLGVHTTVRPDGDVWLGPNAVLALAREGYRRSDLDVRDLLDTLRSPGFRRLARQHWRVGGAEMLRDLSARLLVRSAQKLLPELEVGDVVHGPSGIRAQALDDDGRLVDDFVIDRSAGVTHVRNAPSPGATSSLAIGSWIADQVDSTL